jgi:hypothetical protein
METFVKTGVPWSVLVFALLVLGLITNFIDFDFWQNLVVTFIGVMLGVPSAFWLQNEIERKKRDEDSLKMITILSETIKHNRRLLEQVMDRIGANNFYVPYHNFDVVILEDTSFRKFELISDFELAKQIDVVRYELTHLNAKLELVRQLTPDWLNEPEVKVRSNKTPKEGDSGLFPKMYLSLLPHLGNTLEIIEKVDDKLTEVSEKASTV